MMAGSRDELERLREDVATLQKRADSDRTTIDALRDQLRDHRREMQHQVRNLLSIVRSIARRTVAEGETAEEFQARLDSRLASVTRTQGYMLRYPDTGVDLAELIVGELLAFDVDVGAGAQVEGQTVSLLPTAAGVLGLAFHELARLTIEGRTMSPKEGLTDVRWWIDAEGPEPRSLTIEWRDTGRGLDAASLQGSAFAHDVLEQAIPYQLKGDVHLDLVENGLLWVVRVPGGCIAVS